MLTKRQVFTTFRRSLTFTFYHVFFTFCMTGENVSISLRFVRSLIPAVCSMMLCSDKTSRILYVLSVMIVPTFCPRILTFSHTIFLRFVNISFRFSVYSVACVC
jgi:hypothetical protein